MTVAARAAETAYGEPVWREGDTGLASVMALVGRLRSVVDRVEVAVAGQVVERGTPGGRGLGPVDWLVEAAGESAPRPDPRHAARVLAVAAACRPCAPGGEVFGAAFRSGAMPLDKAAQVAGFVRQVRGVGDLDAVAADVATLCSAACDDRDGRGLSSGELGRAIRFAVRLITPARDLEKDEDRLRMARALHKGPGPAGMSAYRLLLDPEGAAVLDAALSALSAPVSGPDGERDLRTAATRRADALLEVVRRGVSAPGETPKSEKAQVVVTIPLAHLLDGCRGAGLTMSGQLLSPAVVRRMACDARIIPMVLGSQGELLDLGRGQRLFTPAQRRAVWHRDQQCSYPGCTIPAGWCDVHHVRWWSRGGETNLTNGALLCGRHHTLVHHRDLTATVTDTGVTWHL